MGELAERAYGGSWFADEDYTIERWDAVCIAVDVTMTRA